MSEAGVQKYARCYKGSNFSGIDADKLKLRKVEIPDNDDKIDGLTFHDRDILLPSKSIGSYFKNLLELIHLIISPPELTETQDLQKIKYDSAQEMESSFDVEEDGTLTFFSKLPLDIMPASEMIVTEIRQNYPI
ncbi:12768_t:CDS:2 [Cetraspora pellucida]|uniref:12768_t:CDS:1 n=1 Tax=Cetraspora pellucida TaxID=1433469 RepID=A0A9N8W6J6_9GLOM|nr:12768_t:CDS:2 [Cetraspora pellucida]